MANQEHLEILKQGVETWNQWRNDHPEIQPDLSEAYLVGTDLRKAHLERTNLHNTYLGAEMDSPKSVPPANLQGAFFDKLTNLEGVFLGNDKAGFVSLVDVDWNGVNLAVVEWKQVQMLGEEFEARKLDNRDGIAKKVDVQIKEYQVAIRANRQLAIALQNQGLNEQASYFVYRAQVNQRYLFKLQVLQELEQIPVVRLLLFKPNKKLSRYKPLFMALLIPPLLFALNSLILILRGWGNFTIKEGVTVYNLQTIHRSSYRDLYISIIVFISIVLLYLIIFKLSFRVFLIFLAVLSFYLIIALLIIELIFDMLIASDIFYLISIIPILLITIFARIFINLIELLMVAFIPNSSRRDDSEAKLLIWVINLFKKFHSIIRPFISIQTKYVEYLFSLFIDLLAGYGYRPGRSVLWYLTIIFGFALAYRVVGGLSLFPPDAVVFSIMSFHGRGFFPSISSETNLHNPLVMLAAVEAIVGLFIEISFIATFTQRFFGK